MPGVPVVSNPGMAALEEIAEADVVAPAVALVETHDPAAEAGQRRVEGVLVRSTLVGMGLGALICACIWVGLVSIALVGKGWEMLPMLLVGIVCGVFAGIFLGGWAGALYGASKLEHYEHEHLRG